MTAIFSATGNSRVPRADEGFDELLRAAGVVEGLSSSEVPDFAAHRREIGMPHPIPKVVAHRFNCCLTTEDASK